MQDLFLVYVKPICIDNGLYNYYLLFSEMPETVWGKDWDDNNPSTAISGDLTPNPSTYNCIKRISSKYPFKTIQETSCYSMEYAVSRAIALAWIDIENLDEYPVFGRCVMHFADSYQEVENQLNKYKIQLFDIKKETDSI